MSEIFEVLLFWQKKPISSINIKKVNIIKMEYKKMSHCCRNNSKSNMKIVERGKIDTPNTQIDDRSLSCVGNDTANTQIHYRSLFWLGTGTSVKSGIVKLVSWAQTTLLSEMMRS
jgi:hypothetical protein